MEQKNMVRCRKGSGPFSGTLDPWYEVFVETLTPTQYAERIRGKKTAKPVA